MKKIININGTSLVVSTTGDITKLNGTDIKQTKSKAGYRTITINKKKYLVHRLVALAFIPEFNTDSVINHKNSIRHDNRLVNIEVTNTMGNASLPVRKINKCIYSWKQKKLVLFRIMFKDHGTNKLRTWGYFKTREEAEKAFPELHKIRYGLYPNDDYSVKTVKHTSFFEYKQKTV